MPSTYLTIGEVAQRSGVNASALRFYERRQLIQSDRSQGNQRRYHRAVLRRVALIRVAQHLGFTLTEITDALSHLPQHKQPSEKDWQKLSKNWRDALNERISLLERTRDQLDGCIGCGCLSLERCALYNPTDQVAKRGPGPQLLYR